MRHGPASTNVDGMKMIVADHVMTIRFDREHKRNSITYDMYHGLTASLKQAALDDQIRCILLASSGSIFSGGHDVSGFAQGMDRAYDEKPSFAFMECLSTFPKPVVAALNGDAIGIGATMLFHCDFIYAVPGCRLVFPFARMGLVPEFASSFFLPRLVGHRKAMALLLIDGSCSAEEAAELGIINEIVPNERLESCVAATLARIVALSPEAVTLTKSLLMAENKEAVRIAIRQEAKGFHHLLQSPFVRERLAAIKQKISGFGHHTP
ncbi:enoyl-CoA hydratase/isomerase family protein [Sphingomonas sp. KC8]|uniref:enoyl-CoA hydratase/isomerase family protein n=1 Tax=Sphingomonas sp. KC8 TaxID=1030157 RepID=UPI000498605F|nr:enoyl-CoA hydratase-related protein [Sphingomonas sp. KC8]ARS29477.1 enoyl-CoA hydratase [Sphingomonas sp. KC8]